MSDSINKAIRAIQDNSEVVSHSQEEIDIILELIEKYEVLVHGEDNNYGILSYLDHHDGANFIEDVDKIKQLRKELNI